MRECKRCGRTKSLEDFPRRSGIPKRYNPRNKRYEWILGTCRECTNEKQRRKYHKNIEAYRRGRRENYKTHKKKVFDYYGYECVCCGESEVFFLDVDHINNDGHRWKDKNGKRATRNVYQWLVQHRFPEGFQILCANCNQGKRRNKGVCPHSSQEGSTIIRRRSTPKRGEALRVPKGL